MVKGFFLLGDFNILLEEKPCPWSPRWQIMGFILLVSQIVSRIHAQLPCSSPESLSNQGLMPLFPPLLSITSGLGLQRIKEEVSESIYLHPYLPLTQYEEKRLGTWWQKLSTLCRGSETSCEVGKTGVEQLKHLWSSQNLVSLTAQWHQVGVGGDLDQTGIGFSYSSPICSTPDHDCHKILLISSTDLGALQIPGHFYQNQTTLSHASFFLPKIKLVLGSSSPRFACERTSASSILVFLDIFFCSQAKMDTSIDQSIPHNFHTSYRNVKYLLSF